MTAISTQPRLRITKGELAMALFLMAEAMLFAGLISACALLRANYPGQWPPPNQPRLPVPITLANTLILLLSGTSLAMSRGRSRFIALTIALATTFLAIQGWEWSRLISFGIADNVGTYAAIFYALIGVHALHAIGGLIAVLWLWRQHHSSRAPYMYWYFVVGVWPILYALVYV
jgi:cytochrome c oxidase subunit 3